MARKRISLSIKQGATGESSSAQKGTRDKQRLPGISAVKKDKQPEPASLNDALAALKYRFKK
jgi:hypothetical protein